MTTEHKGYRIVQHDDGSVWISNGNIRTHTRCDRMLNQEELIEYIESFIKLADILFEEADNE